MAKSTARFNVPLSSDRVVAGGAQARLAEQPDDVPLTQQLAEGRKPGWYLLAMRNALLMSA